MPQDTFFTKTDCDRCKKSLSGPGFKSFIMSWFTEETICMECSAKEAIIKAEISQTLKAKNDPLWYKAMEGCGFVPQKGKDY